MGCDVESLIKLSSIEGIKETSLQELISRFNPLSKAFSASQKELSKLVGDKTAFGIKRVKNKNVDPEISVFRELNVKIIAFGEKSYPENLKPLDGMPPILYVRGAFLQNDQEAIAIIGSRRATPYGKLIAEKFAYEIASAGVTVISGLARGIDTYVHQGALKAGGRTITVLGSGIDVIYPPENRDLVREIIANGACISEFPIGTPPWAGNFLTRNRLISGLSKAVVVIEATLRSGVFSTVKWALEQGREVFAVPGNITSETSKGANKLIAEGAIPAASPQDILEYLGLTPKPKKEEELKLSEEENKVFGLLDFEPKHADNLAEMLGITVPKILNTLLNLELRGIVKQLPGRNFVRNT